MAKAIFISAIAVLGLILACTPLSAPPPAGTPMAQSGCIIDDVIDGDTVHMSCEGGPNDNLRLMGFDTPETYRAKCATERALGLQAKQFLQQQIAKASSIIPQTHGRDRYQRLLARLYLDGVDVADIMIAAGLAVRYSGGTRINWCAKLGA